MSRNEAIRYILLRSLGNFLVLFALYGVIATFGPVLMAEARYLVIQERGITYEVSSSKYHVSSREKDNTQTIQNTKYEKPNTNKQGFTQILTGDRKQILIPIDPLFSILIPKLGANAKVYPNVDPDNQQEYLQVLQQGVAHAKGSVFPGQSGTTYLFAHSADNWWDVGRYNAVFYTLNNLTVGDEIDIFFEDVRYTYHVTQKIISDPQDSTFLTSQHSGPQRLVLQTCWPPGTTLKRLYIVAEPKST